MSVLKLEKEFLGFCEQLSPGELSNNSELRREIIEVRRMIARLKTEYGEVTPKDTSSKAKKLKD